MNINQVSFHGNEKESNFKDFSLSTEEPFIGNNLKENSMDMKRTNHHSNSKKIKTYKKNSEKNTIKNYGEQHKSYSKDLKSILDYSKNSINLNKPMLKEINKKETPSINNFSIFKDINNISENAIFNKNSNIITLEKFNQYAKTVYEGRSKINKEQKNLDSIENHIKKIAFLEENTKKISRINNDNNNNTSYKKDDKIEEKKTEKFNFILNNTLNKYSYKKNSDIKSNRREFKIINEDNIEKFQKFDS